jgi:hypothetical protein
MAADQRRPDDDHFHQRHLPIMIAFLSIVKRSDSMDFGGRSVRREREDEDM